MSKLHIRNRYATIPNELLNNQNISLKAKGLFAYLQSKPEDWTFSKARIAAQLKEGEKSITKAMAELKEFGYLQNKPVQDKKGKFIGQDYILDDNPSPLTTETPVLGDTDKGGCISKKDYSKKDYKKKELLYSENKFSQEVVDIMELFANINPSIQYGNKTQRKACKDMIKKFGYEDTIRMVKQVISVQGEQYAPIATTPYKMYYKLADFKVYFDKKKSVNKVLDLSL